MRILHVTPYFAPAFAYGGPPRSILALCRAQQAAGLDVEVLTTTANGAAPLPSAACGTRYEGVAVRYFPVRGPAMFCWAPQLGGAVRELAPRADIVHIHSLFNATAWQAHRAARRHRRPLVVSSRGTLETEARAHHFVRKRGAWMLFDRRIVEDAALIHTTSSRETASVRVVAPHTPTAEIPNAVDARPESVTDADRRAIRARLGLAADEPIVLFLGRLHPIKRLDLAARAFARVAARQPRARLVVAGDGAPQVRAEAEPLLGTAASRVVWAGLVEGRDRDALLAESAALVMCSDSENFGMSVAEALAFGVVPVVTQTCPWEILERAAAGCWVPQTIDAIAEALGRVLADPAAARLMGERGRQLAASRFHPDAIGAQWAREYARLL